MHDLEFFKPALIYELRTQRHIQGRLFAPEIKDIGEKHGLRYLDHGTGSVVFKPDTPQNKVIGIDHVPLDPIAMKSKIYFHKILAILFPHNFPTIHSGFGADEDIPGSFSGTVRQEIVKQIPRPQEVLYPFTKVRSICSKWNVNFDPNGANYFITKEGEEFFIDTVQITPAIIENLDNIRMFMNESTEYSEKNRKLVNIYIQRLRRLNL